MTNTFIISGLSCSSCAIHTEDAVKKVNGVENVSVNFLTKKMIVSGEYDNASILYAVKKAGYSAKIEGSEEIFKDNEVSFLCKRLISSLIFVLLLMYLCFGVMYNFPLPIFLKNNPSSIAFLECLLSTFVLFINRSFFSSGFKSLIRLRPNMNSLVSLGSGISYLYSIVQIFILFSAVNDGNGEKAHTLLHSLYFESASMILLFITLGKMLEEISKGKTKNSINSLLKLKSKNINIIKEGNEKTINIEEAKVGDIFIVRPGEIIPLDGKILSGESALNESSLTGESVPVDKKSGDEVFASTINTSGSIKCVVTKKSDETLLSEIIRITEEATESKAPIERITDKISRIFVPLVMGISLITFLLSFIFSKDFSLSLSRAISVLVVSCPCALGLATPVAIMVGTGVGARCGILFKNATSIEELSRCKIASFDKTGTITKGNMALSSIIPYGIDNEEFITLFSSLEEKSEHPLGKAVSSLSEKKLECSNFVSHSGYGVEGVINNKKYYGGSEDFIFNTLKENNPLKEETEKLREEGKSVIFLSSESEFLGLVALSDEIRPESIKTIKNLHKSGLKVVLISGDNEKTSSFVGKYVGIDTIYSEVLPGEKAEIINSLKKEGKVVMVGDGINDAPSLALSDVGVAIGSGSDTAKEGSDVILIQNNLNAFNNAFLLSKRTMRIIKENLFWAFFYNLLLIPIASGLLSPLGITISPIFASAAMSLSSLTVVLNSLRINLFMKKKTKKIVLSICDMMCHGCERNIKKAIENLNGIIKVSSNYKTGIVKIKGTVDSDKTLILNAIKESGYTLTSYNEENGEN